LDYINETYCIRVSFSRGSKRNGAAQHLTFLSFRNSNMLRENMATHLWRILLWQMKNWRKMNTYYVTCMKRALSKFYLTRIFGWHLWHHGTKIRFLLQYLTIVTIKMTKILKLWNDIKNYYFLSIHPVGFFLWIKLNIVLVTNWENTNLKIRTSFVNTIKIMRNI
jgi:hypothetical protein